VIAIGVVFMGPGQALRAFRDDNFRGRARPPLPQGERVSAARCAAGGEASAYAQQRQ